MLMISMLLWDIILGSIFLVQKPMFTKAWLLSVESHLLTRVKLASRRLLLFTTLHEGTISAACHWRMFGALTAWGDFWEFDSL